MNIWAIVNALIIVVVVIAAVAMIVLFFMTAIHWSDDRAVKDGFLIHKGELYIVTKSTAPTQKSNDK